MGCRHWIIPRDEQCFCGGYRTSWTLVAVRAGCVGKNVCVAPSGVPSIQLARNVS